MPPALGTGSRRELVSIASSGATINKVIELPFGGATLALSIVDLYHSGFLASKASSDLMTSTSSCQSVNSTLKSTKTN